ncbi:MAG: DUF397 domain-containing protein [Actinomadura sp.]
MNPLDLSTARWRKSSRSGGQGGACVEVAALAPLRDSENPNSPQSISLPGARWQKSSHSGGQGGNCVEVAALAPVVGLRDSKNPHGPALVIGTAAWRTFTHQIKAGDHDLP